MSVQGKLPFVERKKGSTMKFYSKSEDVFGSTTPKSPNKSMTNTVRRSRRVKKIISLDSDEENIDCNYIRTPIKQKMQTKVCISDSDDEQGVVATFVKQDCSPPKIKRSNARYIASSPTNSSLFNNLTLEENSENECTSIFIDKYQIARQALHSTAPVSLPGREHELTELENLIHTNMKQKSSASLYISGPPGTGKTACLSKIIQKFKAQLKIAYVNCTGIKSSKAIYHRVAEELGIQVSGYTERESKIAIETYLHGEHGMILLILDEIDQLDSRKQNILYTIFEWPSHQSSMLILIGIANALDLTDRILPRLQSRCELKPKLMHFAPYSKSQIMSIFQERLQESGACDVFSPIAVQLLAGKVASVSGDVRRALDIGRRAIELAEQQQSIHPEDISVVKPVGVELQQVVKVLNNVYSTSHTLDIKDSEDSNDQTELPLQQCILLCSLLLLLKNSANRDITVGRLHDVYKRVCKKQNVMAMDQTEFVGLCSLVDARGVIRVSGKKEPRLQKICLQWDEDEVRSILQDKQLMAAIIQDTSCVSFTR